MSRPHARMGVMPVLINTAWYGGVSAHRGLPTGLGRLHVIHDLMIASLSPGMLTSARAIADQHAARRPATPRRFCPWHPVSPPEEGKTDASQPGCCCGLCSQEVTETKR